MEFNSKDNLKETKKDLRDIDNSLKSIDKRINDIRKQKSKFYGQPGSLASSGSDPSDVQVPGQPINHNYAKANNNINVSSGVDVQASVDEIKKALASLPNAPTSNQASKAYVDSNSGLFTTNPANALPSHTHGSSNHNHSVSVGNLYPATNPQVVTTANTNGHSHTITYSGTANTWTAPTMITEDGDLELGRDAKIGRNLVVEGEAEVTGDLRVKGFIKADDIGAKCISTDTVYAEGVIHGRDFMDGDGNRMSDLLNGRSTGFELLEISDNYVLTSSFIESRKGELLVLIDTVDNPIDLKLEPTARGTVLTLKISIGDQDLGGRFINGENHVDVTVVNGGAIDGHRAYRMCRPFEALKLVSDGEKYWVV